MLDTFPVAARAVLAALLVPLAVQAQRQPGVRYFTPEALAFRPFAEEEGAKIVILHGNPAEAGHYIVRLEFAPNWDGRPHVHGGWELLTIQSGTCYVADGDDLTRSAARELPEGSFVAFPPERKMRAFAGDDGCLVDIQGQGPFTTRYLDEEGGR